MSLSPEIEPILDDEEMDDELPQLRTYRIDFENKRITNEIITGREAIEQFVHIALRIPRYTHAIYTSETGNEIAELLRDPDVTIEYKEMELARFIEESLVYSEWIDAVANIDIEHADDKFNTSFEVHTDEGVLELQEVFSAV